MNKQELLQKRAKLIADARKFHEERTAANAWTADDQAKFDKMMDDADEFRVQADKLDSEARLAATEKELGEIRAETRETPEAEKPSGEYRDARGNPITKAEAEKRTRDYERYLRGEIRALEAGDDVQGGYLQPTQQMMQGFLKNVDDLVHIRRLAQKETMTQAESLGILTLNDPDDFDWTTELATGSADNSLSFGKRELRPHPLAKSIKVSRTLLRKASRSPIDIVNERFAYKLGITQEKAYLTGNGAGQPLGVFTASSDGVPTSRDVSTDMTTTAITADGLMEVKHTLKSQYWAGARWMFHRDAVKQIAKLKDGNGQYLFDTDRNSVLSFPIDVNENAPNTFTTGLYVGILANWQRGYMIVDALNLTTQRLDELYAATNQVGFIMRYEGDGAPILAEAFVRVKLA